MKSPQPRSKRFNHVCKSMRLVYPYEWKNLLGTDASGHWEFWIAEIKFEVFHCPFCGRDLNEQFSDWVCGELWEK